MDDLPRITEGDWLPLDLVDAFSTFVGPLYALSRPGDADEPRRIGFRVAPQHCNRLDTCHGGMLGTVLDVALGVVGNAIYGTTAPTPTMALAMDFLQPARLGDWVESRVRLVHATRRMNFVEGALVTAKGPILRGNATFRRLAPAEG